MSMVAQINTELLVWANQNLSQWQQEAFRRLLSKSDLTEKDKDDIFDRALFDFGFKKSPTDLPVLSLTATDLPACQGTEQTVRLLSLQQVQNVNALKSGQRISFGKQLTVIFGQNASGKSGYARLMKAACSAKAVEDILPDVFATSAPQSPPSAAFEIETISVATASTPCVSKTTSIPWEKDKPSSQVLKRFRVFDSKCGRIYINQGNRISFAPQIFDSLQKLGAFTQEIKQRFEDLSSRVAPDPEALKQLIDETSIGKMLASLTSGSDRNTLTQVAQWTNDDVTELKGKQDSLRSLLVNSPEKVRKELDARNRRLLVVKAHLRAMEDSISDASIENMKKRQSEAFALEQASQAAAELAFGDTHLDGIGSAAWKELINAAAKYSTTEAYPGQPFPASEDGARCVLCLQPLSLDSKSRLKSFWSFIQDETSQKRDKAQEEVTRLTRAFAQRPHSLPTDIEAIEDSLSQSHPRLTDEVKAYFSTAVERLATIEAAIGTKDWSAISQSPVSLLAKCDQDIQTINNEIAAIARDNQTKALIDDLSKEVAELSARERLSKNLKHVLDHLTSLQVSAAASAAAESIHTHTISNSAKALQKKFVTEQFVNSVKAELKLLGLRRVHADISEHSEYGKVLHTVTIGNALMPASPESIFSEGERTALALACFFADLGPAEETCGIVLDDPLTSLDHQVRDGLIRRIVHEAKTRQVVVFTHDLPFYCELLHAAETEPVECLVQHVESFSTATGYVSSSEPWDALRVNQRMGHMEQLINEAQNADGKGESERFRDCVDRFYRHLRSTWERSVEEGCAT